MKHYCCYNFWLLTTHASRITQSGKLFPAHAKFPELSPATAALLANQELTKALLQIKPKSTFIQTHTYHLTTLATIFITSCFP